MQRQRHNPYALKMYRLYLGGLIAFIFVVLQAFLGVDRPDIWIVLSVSSFALALPPLAGALIMNQITEEYIHERPQSPRARVMRAFTVMGVVAALFGMVTAFCHISQTAGGLFFVMLLVTAAIIIWYAAEFRK